MPAKIKWIIVADKYGQAGNRFFLFAHFIAYAMEHNVCLANFYFNEFGEYFDCARYNKYDSILGPATKQGAHQVKDKKRIRITTRISRLTLLHDASMWLITKFTGLAWRFFPVGPWYRILRVYDREQQGEFAFLEMESAEFESCLDRKFLLTQGFGFRAFECVKRHREALKSLFQLAPPYRENVSRLMQQYREGADLVTGVHIRRGDYGRHLAGSYLYDFSVYRRLMEEMLRLHPGKKIRFLLCSNEPLPLELFNGLPIVMAGGHFLEDMYCLAGCDFILGPPSTYSQWASFYGHVPLMIVRHKDQSVLPDQFSVSDL